MDLNEIADRTHCWHDTVCIAVHVRIAKQCSVDIIIKNSAHVCAYLYVNQYAHFKNIMCGTCIYYHLLSSFTVSATLWSVFLLKDNSYYD